MAASDNALFLLELNVLLHEEDVFKLPLLTRQTRRLACARQVWGLLQRRGT